MKKTISTNPPGQLQQGVKGSSMPLKTGGSPCDDDERGGKVEKRLSHRKTEDLALAKLCGKKVQTVDFGQRPILGCRRQVFSSIEVAETTAIGLARLGIKASVERCCDCKLIHLKEVRKNDPAPSRRVG